MKKMIKFKENNPIDIITALCQMGNTESVGTFEMPWSDDNSEQMEQIRCTFIPDSWEVTSWEVVVNDDQIIKEDKTEIKMAYTPGFYLYSYNEELPTGIIDTYTMKIEIKYATLRFGEATEHNTIIYLYYIGD